MSKRRGRPNVDYAKAREYLLANPGASKIRAAIDLKVSETTVARARRFLIAEGLLPPSRRTSTVPPVQSPALPVKTPVATKTSKDSMLDHAAMVELATMVDTLVDGGDDEQTQNLLLKQCLTFALNPKLHPDTRMSASTMWAKLRDMKKAKDLGPGKPKTREEAKARLAEMNLAVGPELAYEAFCVAFTPKETPNGSSANEQAVPVGGPPETPRETGHDGVGAEAEVVRPIEVGVRGDGPEPDLEDPNLPGPEAGRESEAGPPRATPHLHGDTPGDRPPDGV